MNFNILHEKRKAFMARNKNFDHVLIEGKNCVLISAPPWSFAGAVRKTQV